ncbi:hypothetical protein HAX54_005068 [Datura stramonium]|uniref:DUF4283 domain-containing protein n=1 Tax=Datura stramonium TaxID=4076 RepID=A0ABS8T8T6_DATST|nr:hypothetical protein [Datura stramonium]
MGTPAAPDLALQLVNTTTTKGTPAANKTTMKSGYATALRQFRALATSDMEIRRISIDFEGQIMWLEKWSPDFKSDEDSPIVPVWVLLPDLPFHCHTWNYVK